MIAGRAATSDDDPTLPIRTAACIDICVSSTRRRAQRTGDEYTKKRKQVGKYYLWRTETSGGLCCSGKHDPQSTSPDRDPVHEFQSSAEDLSNGTGRRCSSFSFSRLPSLQDSNRTLAGGISKKAENGKSKSPSNNHPAEHQGDNGNGGLQQ